MKALKKLVPTMCLLLVSAVLLGTSTYAWFSMNASVTASNMQVKATAPSSVEISQDHSNWSYTTAFTAPTGTQNTLEPTYYDATTNKFYIPTAANTIKVDGSATVAFDASKTDSWTALADTVYENGAIGSTQYLAVYTLYLRTNVGTATGGTPVSVTCKIESKTGGALAAGVKVGILNTTNNTVTELSTTASSTTWQAALSSSNPAYTTIKVVIWYDGQENQTVNNTNADGQATTIALKFEGSQAETPTPTPAG